MNVQQLIKKLEKLDPKAMVVVSGYEGGVNEVKSVSPVTIDLNVNDEWYYGKHEVVDDATYSHKEGLKQKQAVLVGAFAL